MNKYRDQLEGSTQLFRIRRLRRIIFLFLLVLMVVLAAAAMAFGGASLKPAFFPLNGVVSVVVVLAFVATVAGLAFRSLEIRYAKRESQRFLIAKASIRTAWTVLVVGVILGVVLLVPFTGQALDNAVRDTRTVSVPPRSYATISFPSSDAFALSRFVGASLTLRGQFSGWLYGNWSGGGTNQSLISATEIRPYPGKPFVEYTIAVQNQHPVQAVEVTLVVNRQAMPELTTIVPVVFLAFAVTEGLWIAHARPIRAKYAASSIYSVRYEEAADAGERTFAEYFRGTQAPMAPAGAAPPTPVAAASEPVPIVPALAQVSAPPPPPPPPPPPEVLPGGPPTPEERPVSDLLEEGSRLFSDGQFEPALALFDEVLEREPTNVRALLAGATVLVRLGRADEALRQYDQALGFEPRNAKALAGRAKIFEGQGRWAQTAEAWGKYLEVVPPDLEARMSQAEAILNTGDRAGAVRALEQALFLAPSDSRIRQRIESLTVNVPQVLSRALVASASGRYDEALVDFGLILAVDPDNVNALVGKGVALRRSGQRDEALGAFDLALAKQPGNSAALHAKGSILEEKGNYPAALDAYDDLLAWNPRDPEVWAIQGSLLEKVGEPEEALASYMEALKLDPGNAEWRKRADALESARKGQEAFLEELFTIEGVGPARARELLGAGYKTADALRNATEDQLADVKGMTRQIARDIYRHFHPEAAPPTPGGPAPMD